MRLDDPAVVRDEYASEKRLAARKAAYRFAEGPDARDLAFQAVAEADPRRVLEVGPGEGELAERIIRELKCELVAVDQSERMVELTRARGVDARVGDAQSLPFEDGQFDSALAAWMLYHVSDLGQALAELARVVRNGGRLVAVTNGEEHLAELAEMLGGRTWTMSFNGENGADLLLRHFARVERREAYGWVDFPNRRSAQDYVDATIMFGGRQLPDFKGQLRVRIAPVVFVAHKA